MPSFTGDDSRDKIPAFKNLRLEQIGRKRCYVAELADGGRRVFERSVTQITGQLNKPGLVWWAASCAAEHAAAQVESGRLAVDVEEARKAHLAVSARAMKIGTVVHAAAEQGAICCDDPALLTPAEHCFRLLKDWRSSRGLEVISTERAVCNHILDYAGTLDFLARGKDGRLILGDYKTGKDCYTEYRMQMGGYSLAIQAMGEAAPDEAIVILLPKPEDGQAWTEVPIWRTPEERQAWELAFINACHLHSALATANKISHEPVLGEPVVCEDEFWEAFAA